MWSYFVSLGNINMVRHDGQVRLCDQKTLWIKMAASAHDQIDRWLIMIGVIVEDSRWSSNDGGESHGGLGVLMEVACLWIVVIDATRCGGD